MLRAQLRGTKSYVAWLAVQTGPLKLQQGSVDLGDFTQGRPRLRQNAAELDELVPKGADDGHSVVTRAIAECASHKQSLVLSSGGGGNRTHAPGPWVFRGLQRKVYIR